MSSWLKAGLVGGAVLVVLDLLGLIPLVGFATCCLGIVAYVGVGLIAGLWMPSPREPGRAAGEGALAAVIAALIGGLANIVILVLQAVALGPDRILSQLSPNTISQLEQLGMDPRMLDTFAGPAGAALGSSICCLGGLILAAILGAIGGAVYAAVQPD
jgi:hypothetical protein